MPIRSDFQSSLKSGSHNSNMYYITYSFQISPSICQMTQILEFNISSVLQTNSHFFARSPNLIICDYPHILQWNNDLQIWETVITQKDKLRSMAPLSDVCQLLKPRQSSQFTALATSQKPGFNSQKKQRFLSSPPRPNQPPYWVHSPGLGEVRKNGLDIKVFQLRTPSHIA
jgi:hypothetical protein